MLKIRRALISISDKTGLEGFVKGLHKLGIEILSTGGTAKFINDLGIPTRSVSDYTGFPEMLDGRVKTLHPKIHGGLLALRDKKEHIEQVERYGIELIDMVVVNLYPFEKTIQKENVTKEEAIENIDIGGPSMLRSAAKNFRDVVVICSPARYGEVLKELQENNGIVSEELREELAKEVFETTSQYDKAISEYFQRQPVSEKCKVKSEKFEVFPEILELRFKKLQDLRYGENPHQRGAFYKLSDTDIQGITTAKQLHGKELSFNNILDLNSGCEIVKEFETPAASIIKHNNPCGAATAKTLANAYLEALECDKLSAFGSVVGFNKVVDIETAKAITSADFVECVIAPGYEKEALGILKKKKNLRVMEVRNFQLPASSFQLPDELDFKRIIGGLLVQDLDKKIITEVDLKVVTKKAPTKKEIESLLFGQKIVKYVRSNAILFSQGTSTVGIGAGQMSRVDSMMIAIRKAGQRAKGSTCASDAFFPKEDAIEEAAKAGISSIIQPGGSIRDEYVIRACDDAGISMVFTGVRHFKH